MPIGNPSIRPSAAAADSGLLRVTLFVKPHGTEIAGIPASGWEQRKISSRYIATGSPACAPTLNAGVGETGERITSTFLNASSKSFLMSVRTFCALLHRRILQRQAQAVPGNAPGHP